jgi:hypothetical protein
MTLDGSNGNVNVNGTFTAGNKLFEIDHPTKPGYKLVHGTLEGPESAVFYRGEGRLADGKARVTLPDYFEALTRKEGRTVLAVPVFDAEDEVVSALAVSHVASGTFTVRALDQNNPGQPFFWEVKAVRADVDPLQVERPFEQRESAVPR